MKPLNMTDEDLALCLETIERALQGANAGVGWRLKAMQLADKIAAYLREIEKAPNA